MAKKKSQAVDAPYKGEDDWRAESDARTLMQADEIRKDKGRLAKAKAWAKKQLAAMSAIK